MLSPMETQVSFANLGHPGLWFARFWLIKKMQVLRLRSG
jgi:hypothetical protein